MTTIPNGATQLKVTLKAMNMLNVVTEANVVPVGSVAARVPLSESRMITAESLTN